MTGERPSTRELDWQALLDTALTAPGNLHGVYSRFHSYSFMNNLLLQMQGVEGPCATYKRWQSLGRQVVMGAKAAEIVRPITVMRKNEDGEVEATYKRFRFVKCIFGCNQTEGEDLPPVATPGWDLDTALAKLDIRRVPFTDLQANVMGWSSGREISISPMAPNPLKTTLHEVGHVTLGHTNHGNHAEYVMHQGVKEFQAEATAYLTLNELELLDERTAAVSRAYCQHWLRDEQPNAAAVRQVFVATDQLLRAGRPNAAHPA